MLWSEAVRVAVVEQAETQPPATFARNGFTVTARQAAWSAIHATGHFEARHPGASVMTGRGRPLADRGRRRTAFAVPFAPVSPACRPN